MTRILEMFEKAIVIALLVLMMLAILASAIELGVILFQQLLEPPFLLLDMKEMLEVFGFFLMVLIGLELLETVRAYLQENEVHAEIVFLVAMVAVARKVIILEYKDMSPDLLYGMSAIIISLSAGYFLVKRALARPATPACPGKEEPS